MTIASAGRFGSLAGPGGFKVNVLEGGGSVRVEANLLPRMCPILADIPEPGGTIHGNPFSRPNYLLSIFGNDAQAQPGASDYPGQLFRVDRKDGKAPLCCSREASSSTGDHPAVPKYFGKSSVEGKETYFILMRS